MSRARVLMRLVVVALLFDVGLIGGRASAPAPQKRGSTPSSKTPSTWVPTRTPDGHPDLQGVWDYRNVTPLERPAQFAGKEFLADAEVAEYERRAAARTDGRPPDDPRTDPSVQPPEWLDYGKKMIGGNRSSLIVDPPDGRIPPLTAAAQAEAAARQDKARARGAADDPEIRSTWERYITRGFPEGVLPAGYNNNIQIFQSPGYVVIVMEMIHDARIIPLDGRPHLPRGAGQWMGDSRGQWEGNTLVVDTVNFSEKTNFRGSSEGLHLLERFTRTGETTIDYRFTVNDPTTWTKPWTVSLPLVRNDGQIYEYACHEGNRGLANILSQARTVERASAAAK
jgi:hypothetical protein